MINTIPSVPNTLYFLQALMIMT